MRNVVLGLNLAFNSEGINISRSVILSPRHFIDQACKIVDCLASVFEIETFLSPSVAVDFQKGFNVANEPQAEKALRELGLVSISEKVDTIVGQTPQAFSYALINKVGDRWRDVSVEHNRRLATSVVRQTRRENPEARLLARAKLLPERQREALNAILAAQKLAPEVSPVALQVELENRLEGEVARVDFPSVDFINESIDWAHEAIDRIARN